MSGSSLRTPDSTLIACRSIGCIASHHAVTLREQPPVYFFRIRVRSTDQLLSYGSPQALYILIAILLTGSPVLGLFV